MAVVPDEKKDGPLSVFIAEPLTERMVVDACEGDTPEDLEQRQQLVDRLTSSRNPPTGSAAGIPPPVQIHLRRR